MIKKLLIIIGVIAALLILYFLIKKPVSIRYNNKGIESFEAQSFDSAEVYFKKALIWKRRSLDALINIIKTEIELQKLDDADVYIQNLTDYYPEHAETYGLQGQLLVLRKNYDQALPMLTSAIERDSLLSYAFFYRGISKANLDDLEGAAEDYLLAQQLDKGNIEALQERALVLTKMDDFEALIENYDAIISLDPSNTSAFLERGNFKMKIADYENAVDDFSQAIKLNDKLGEAYFNRGKSNANLERFENAQSDFDRAAQLNYKISGSYYNAAMASLKFQNSSMSKSYLNKVLISEDTDEFNDNAYYLLGVIEMMSGNNRKAIVYLSSAIELNTTFIDAYYNRGVANGLLENHLEALRDLEQSLKLGKRTADLYFAMGVQRIALNNFPAGCSDLKTAVDMGSDKAAEMRKLYCKQY